MKLKIKTSVNERFNIERFTTFEVVYSKPEIEEEFSTYNGTKIIEVNPICADLHPTNRYYDTHNDAFYDLYEVVTALDEENPDSLDYSYVAVEVEEEEISEIKKLRLSINMTQQAFSDYFAIPKRTIENWENGQRKCPTYLVELIRYKIENEDL